jgi:hypothetical protein
VHYPVYNKSYAKIASAITTLDLHDIARAARTYDVKAFYVINPLEDQQVLAERVKKHWTEGFGAMYNRDRCAAMHLLEVVPGLERALEKIELTEGESPLVVVTDAALQSERSISFAEMRSKISSGRPALLLFGTAWGLHNAVIKAADYVLAPIRGNSGYNHLSVRTAAAIILDRLICTANED